MGSIYYNDYENELYHYGTKGMKWGVRKYQNADGSLTPAGEKRYGNDPVGRAKLNVKSAKKEYNKSFNKAYNYSTTPRFTKKGKAERDRRWEDTYDKLDKLDKAKADYKATKTKTNKAAVEKYQKKYDEAEKASNMADEKWNNVKEQYKSLGKNRIERMINASRNNTEAAKKYNKAFDDAERASNIADAKWDKVSELYKTTGRNRVERIINNVKYDPDKKK